MVEKLYTGKISSADFQQLITGWDFPENTDDTWVLAEQIPEHVVTNPKDRKEYKKMLLFKLFKPEKSGNQASQLANYSFGRIFSEDMEIRWEKLDGKIQVVYLGAEKYSSALQTYNLKDNSKVLDTVQALDTAQTEEQQKKYYYLFGKWLKDEDIKYKGKHEKEAETEYFAEVRIPQLLLYPVKPSNPDDLAKKPYMRLQVREYTNKDTGIVELFRFQKLELSEGK
jgi:hypothetical protein